MIGVFTSSPLRQAFTFFVILLGAYIYFSRPVEFAGDVALHQNAVYLAAGRDGVHVLEARTPESLELTKHIPINGWVSSVEVSNNRLFVTTGRDGLRVYDLANPLQPVEVGHLNTPGNATDLSILGRTLFIADGRNGVRIFEFDGDTTLNFQERGGIKVRGVPVRVVVDGNRLYVSDRRNFLSIINIGDLNSPKLLGEINMRTRINQIQIIGLNAYLATDNMGMVIIDVSNPENLADAARASYNTPGNARDFSIHANLVYLADGTGGLRVLDIEDPNRIRQVGQTATPGEASRLVYTDNAIYIADGYSGLTVLEADVRVNLRERDSTDNRIVPTSVSIRENYAFITAGEQGLRVLDLSAPSTPFLVQHFSNTTFAADIVTEGDVGYLADRSIGIIILEISDPKKEIRMVGNPIESPGEAQSILLTGDFLYLADGTSGVRIYDKTIPAELVLVGALDTPGSATRMAYMEGILYVADLEAGLRVIDVNDPRAPVEVGAFDTSGEARSVQVFQTAGDRPSRYAYVADGAQGLQILDVTNPRNIRSIARLGARQFFEQVRLSGGNLFVASRGEGVLAYGLSNPTSPNLIGTFAKSLDPVDIDFSSNDMFVADRAHGLRIARIDDLAHPVEIGFFDLPSGAKAFVLGEDSVLLVDGLPGLWLLNRSNVGNFTLRDYAPTIASAQMVRVFGQYAYVLEGDTGVEIVDLGNAELPVVGRIDTPGSARDIQVEDQIAYIADGVRGLMIYDLRDPANPQLRGSLDTVGDARRLTINERYAYIADGPNGLYVARISEIDNPVRVSVSREPREARAVSVSGNYVFVAGGESGLHIYDMTRPLVPVPVANLATVSPVNDVAILGLYAYISQEDGTIQVLDISNPAAPELVGIDKTKNPAMQLAVYEYDNNSGGPLSVAVFVATDTNGLRVLSGQKTLETQSLAQHETTGTAPFRKMLQQILLLGRNSENAPTKAARTWRQVLFDVFVIGLGGLFLWLVIFAQFILPASSVQERMSTLSRLIDFMFGTHGPAVHIRNGVIHQRPGEQSRRGPGVVLVDLSSAAVLIRRAIPMPLIIALVRGAWLAFRRRFGGYRAPPYEPDLRVVGPGLVFTRAQLIPFTPMFYEGIYGVADLRPQVRVQPNVRAYTLDGIELESVIFTGFTIGEKAEVLRVAYIGERAPENLHVIYFDKSDKTPTVVKRVVRIQGEEIDPEDKIEIHRVLHQNVIGIQPPVPFEIVEAQPATPYVFDEKRVFQAVAAEARNVENEGDQHWTDLPKHVATEIFRQMIATEVYDHLYELTDQGQYPIRDLKTKFSYRVRNLGILAYQYLELKDGSDFEVGAEYELQRINAYTARELETPKSLRARGIKINFAGFGELYPVSQRVTDQRVDYWRAHWEADALKKRAPQSYRAEQVRNYGRVLGQRALVVELARAFSMGATDRQAMALRLFQALEKAASNPATRQLLPSTTVSLMDRIKQWL